MWMHAALLDDGTVLNAYKHRWTRCYFHLTEDARTFYYVTDDPCCETEDLYCETDPYTAIKAVFAHSEGYRPTPEERRALRAVLRRAEARDEPGKITLAGDAEPAARGAGASELHSTALRPGSAWAWRRAERRSSPRRNCVATRAY